MRFFAKQAFGVAAGIGIVTTALAAPLPGPYERLPASKRVSGKLVVSGVTRNRATVDLEVLFNPYPSDGHFVYNVDNGLSRNGVLEHEGVAVNGNVALFRAPKEDDPPCSLVFVFERTYVQITQFGECSWFGVGVNATGRYVRRSSQGAQK